MLKKKKKKKVAHCIFGNVSSFQSHLLRYKDPGRLVARKTSKVPSIPSTYSTPLFHITQILTIQLTKFSKVYCITRIQQILYIYIYIYKYCAFLKKKINPIKYTVWHLFCSVQRKFLFLQLECITYSSHFKYLIFNTYITFTTE